MDASTAAVLTAYGTIALAIVTLALVTVTFFLVIFTAKYVKLTHDLSKEAKLTRQDSYRPILIPVDLGQYIRNAIEPRSPQNLYQAVRNVGSGPALNIWARLEGSMEFDETGKSTACVIFDESCGYIHDLPAGESGEVTTIGAYPGKRKDAQDVPILPEYVLKLSYDDIFGRQFVTSYKRTPFQWLSLGEQQEFKHRPRPIRPDPGI